MEDIVILSFITTLQNIRGAGHFCARGSISFVPPGIVLKNGEDLALPLGGAQANDLRSQAEPAPYGMGTETRLDESVRKCWQIDASELGWVSPKWQKSMDALVKEIARELGVDGRVSAQPYKLLMYDKGGFFLPHRDTEKVPGMFGTLIVELPSRHDGGELVVRHQGREQRVDFSAGFDPSEIRWAAFFADCEHEVLPVTSGHRLCLTYNLVIEKGQGQVPQAPTGVEDALLPGLRQIAQTRPDDVTAILMEHLYTAEGLAVAALKGDDRARAAAIFSAAEKVGLTARLALLSLYQMGQPDYESEYYSRGSRWGDDDSDQDMGEILEESLTIDHWRTPEDTVENLGCFGISKENVLNPTEFDDAEPDEKYVEGYTGNAGCTVEHWFRRAAIVLWPGDAGPILLARYDFTAACESFATLAKTGDQKAITLGRALVNEAAGRLAGGDEWQADSIGSRMRGLLRGIGEIRDESLFEMISQTAFVSAFKNADREAWAALLTGFGERPLDFFLANTPAGPVSNHRQSCFHALDAALLHALDLLPRFADLLPRLIAGQLLASRSHQSNVIRFTLPGYHAHLILAASCIVSKSDDRRTLENWLFKEGSLPHLRDVLVPALLETEHGSWFHKKNSLAPGILALTINALSIEAKRAIAPYPDMRRPIPSTSSTDSLINHLLQFMADPVATSHQIKRAQAERSKVEAYVRQHQLDLDLTTVRRGVPHTLVCSKNDQSHHRALQQRAADEKLLEQLRQK